MLKIVDSAGKKIGELKDEDNAPVMEVVPAVGVIDIVLDDGPKQEEGEAEDGSDIR